MQTDPELTKLIRAHPRIIYRYLDDYLAFNFSTHKKLTILANHYKFLLLHTNPDFFKAIQEKCCIWQENQRGSQYSISLEFPFGYDFEGDLLLVFNVDRVPLYSLSFTFVPGEVVDISLGQAIFVGKVQGVTNFELIKHTTKNLHDIIPAALLVAALQGIALVYNVQVIIGVSNQHQLSNEGNPTFFNYDLFWSSLGGNKTKENLFVMAVPFPEKPIDLIKHNHRKRTLRKRQYKNQLMLEASKNFRAFITNGSSLFLTTKDANLPIQG